jgi:hypothetical protein
VPVAAGMFLKLSNSVDSLNFTDNDELKVIESVKKRKDAG